MRVIQEDSGKSSFDVQKNLCHGYNARIYDFKLTSINRMFISSLTLTAVFWACVCFCIVRVSATTTTTTVTPSSGAGTQTSPRGGKHHHHHHHHQHHQEREDSKDRESGSAGRSHSLKIHNFISTDALYDGEEERRIHYNGITAKETAVSTVGTANSTRFVIS